MSNHSNNGVIVNTHSGCRNNGDSSVYDHTVNLSCSLSSEVSASGGGSHSKALAVCEPPGGGLSFGAVSGDDPRVISGVIANNRQKLRDTLLRPVGGDEEEAFASDGEALGTRSNTYLTVTDRVPHEIPKPGEHVFAVDYLTFSVRGWSWSAVAEQIELCLGAEFEEQNHGHGFYKRHARADHGAMICWAHTKSRDFEETVHVILPGLACRVIGMQQLLWIVRTFEGAKVRRCDLAFDVIGLHPDWLWKAWHDGDVSTQIRRDTPATDEPDRMFKKSHSRFESWGRTVAFGVRGSARYLRCYDLHALEHKYAGCRVELEIRGDKATESWAVLDGVPLDSWSEVAMRFVVDFIDFRDRSVDSNVTRCPRLSWWENIVDGVSRLAVPIPRVQRTFSKLVRHVARAYASSMAVINEVARHVDPTQPLDWLYSIVGNGEVRYKPHHRRLIEEGKALGRCRSAKLPGLVRPGRESTFSEFFWAEQFRGRMAAFS